MLYHFQLAGPSGWMAIGTGVGTDPDPIDEALEELRAMSGGALPGGEYRYIAARGRDARFSYFELGEETSRDRVARPAS